MKEETKQGIKNSDVFLVFGTKAYFDDYINEGPVKKQVLYAKYLRKPFRVIKDIGVVIPEGFDDEVEDFKVKEYNIKDITYSDGMEIADFCKSW